MYLHFGSFNLELLWLLLLVSVITSAIDGNSVNWFSWLSVGTLVVCNLLALWKVTPPPFKKKKPNSWEGASAGFSLGSCCFLWFRHDFMQLWQNWGLVLCILDISERICWLQLGVPLFFFFPLPRGIARTNMLQGTILFIEFCEIIPCNCYKMLFSQYVFAIFLEPRWGYFSLFASCEAVNCA